MGEIFHDLKDPMFNIFKTWQLAVATAILQYALRPT